MAVKTASKLCEVEDVGAAEEPVAGQLGVGPLHALAGDAGALREELGGVLAIALSMASVRGLVTPRSRVWLLRLSSKMVW